MKKLIRHLLKTSLPEIVSKSLLNCHVMGLHSIMLLDAPEKRIRLYFADYNHELYKNYGFPQTLAYHPHHCQITLHVVAGMVSNRVAKVVRDYDGNDCEAYDRFLYTSKITTGNEMGFIPDGTDILKSEKDKIIFPGESVFMRAYEIHTVACPEKMMCAWLVYEGKENPNYEPLAWSKNDLELLDTTGLYVKPTERQVMDILSKSGLLS